MIWLQELFLYLFAKPYGPTLNLEPLHPEDKRPEHIIYTKELSHALENPRIHNIALTGSYGSGKSSVLAHFMRSQSEKKIKKGNRIIKVSLAALGDEFRSGQSETKEEESNSIQKEIVKQLLFKEAPHRVPNSKFKRVSAPYAAYVFLPAIFCALLSITALYYFFGVSVLYPLAGEGYMQLGLGLSIFLIIFSLVTLVLLWVNTKSINKLTGGPVSIEASSDTNYFDQYLDELIYFFEVTDYSIVIFEDIERFDNANIFVALKQLNSLLNDAGQIRSTNKHIRFIYAIKDSLFSTGNLPLDQQSANRAKFFDLIIPVVPFVTHQSSSDIITKLFNTQGRLGISKSAIATVARYITDMRLIKNIYNEYLVFAETILGENKLEGLTKDKLFTMIVYKNTNLKDFELIKDGSSKLDAVYKTYRQTITKEVRQLHSKIQANKAKLEAPNSLQARSATYGKRLVMFITTTTAAVQATAPIRYTLKDVNYSLKEMEADYFWKSLAEMEQNDALQVSYTAPPHNYRQILRLTHERIEQIIEASLAVDILEETDRKVLRQENLQLRSDIKALRRMPIDELMNKFPEFSRSVREILADGTYIKLVYDLVASGYIDAYFTLYTSIFHGTNPKAANFLIHHLQLDKPDFFYKFEDEENIKALFADSGSAYAKSRALYNIDILDYLLHRSDAKPPLLDEAISSVTSQVI